VGDDGREVARFQYELEDDGKIRTNADGTISVTWCCATRTACGSCG
jgi:hypothetical protein